MGVGMKRVVGVALASCAAVLFADVSSGVPVAGGKLKIKSVRAASGGGCSSEEKGCITKFAAALGTAEMSEDAYYAKEVSLHECLAKARGDTGGGSVDSSKLTCFLAFEGSYTFSGAAECKHLRLDVPPMISEASAVTSITFAGDQECLKNKSELDAAWFPYQVPKCDDAASDKGHKVAFKFGVKSPMELTLKELKLEAGALTEPRLKAMPYVSGHPSSIPSCPAVGYTINFSAAPAKVATATAALLLLVAPALATLF